jgi:hypothetical protein
VLDSTKRALFLLAVQPVSARENPGPRYVQDIGFLPDIFGEGRERCCQFHDPYCRIIKNFVP